jgi:hypothetical protein
MTPILGIIASQITGHLSTNSYESIATVTVGAGGQSLISFSSIPSTYKHLQIRYFAQTNRGTYGTDSSLVRVGATSGDTGANYSRHNLYGDGSAAYAGGTASATSWTGVNDFGTSTGGIFGVGIFDILDYQNVNKNKTMRELSGVDHNGAVGGFQTGTVTLNSGGWYSTTAIGYIEIKSQNGNNFTQYSSFALYGIK